MLELGRIIHHCHLCHGAQLTPPWHRHQTLTRALEHLAGLPTRWPKAHHGPSHRFSNGFGIMFVALVRLDIWFKLFDLEQG
jgi:hypothetical protein